MVLLKEQDSKVNFLHDSSLFEFNFLNSFLVSQDWKISLLGLDIDGFNSKFME